MIAQTIDSIIRQNFNLPYELIIGEDCSNDKTLEICLDYENRFSDKIKVIAHKRNCGLGKNWALLVKEAKGKYIASCDDDDFWHNPDKLRLQFEFLEENHEYGMVHSDYDILNMRNKKVFPSHYKRNNIKIITGYITNEIFTGKSHICVSTSMFRKSLVDKYVPLNDYIEHRFNIQDWPTWMILSKYSKIGYIPVSTVTYRVGHFAISNYGSLEKTERKVETDQNMYKIICKHLPDDVEYNELTYNRYKLRILLSAAYKKFNFNKAREYIELINVNQDSTLKIRMAKNRLLFQFYAYFLFMKRKLFQRHKY
jgi:glycosyltransferase involved in cell wall biosynthesis